MKKFFSKYKSVRGFTLLELSISLAVMFIMVGGIFAEYPITAMRITLTNVSYSTSLLLREAQLRGSAVDSGNSSPTNVSLSTDSPYGGYGVSMSLLSSGQIILFNDTVDTNISTPYGLAIGNGLYETSPLDETKEITNFPKGYYIKKLCILPDGSSIFSCNANYTNSIESLVVSFTRPNPQPNIYINGTKAESFSAACIELSSPRAQFRSVQVFKSGIIRTQSTKCDSN